MEAQAACPGSPQHADPSPSPRAAHSALTAAPSAGGRPRGGNAALCTPELLSKCLDYLPLADLGGTARVSRRFAAGACSDVLYTKFMPVRVSGASGHECPSWAGARRATQQMRCALRAEEYPNTLVSAAVCSSSDDGSTQTVHETLRGDPRHLSFWSSTGSKHTDSNEYLVYRLSGALALVRTIKFVFYKAFYQLGAPVYPSQRISIELGWGSPELVRHLDCLPPEEALMMRTAPLQQQGAEGAKRVQTLVDLADWEPVPCRPLSGGPWGFSLECRVGRESDEQVFELPHYVAASFIKINFLGKVSRQREDQQYYTVVERLWVNGQCHAAIPAATAAYVAQAAALQPAYRAYAAALRRSALIGRRHPAAAAAAGMEEAEWAAAMGERVFLADYCNVLSPPPRGAFWGICPNEPVQVQARTGLLQHRLRLKWGPSWKLPRPDDSEEAREHQADLEDFGRRVMPRVTAQGTLY
eukprot:TRINITY_DN19809_c0_g1_i1.p1 TRINITY_DN19809_c0_g1~~TRINITY_DN19809_c0_g1_i1.p1  ORF type:complete len:471 (+),score=88.06 TRINITY_DN19809_c0_g1_i1:73-1485(+)